MKYFKTKETYYEEPYLITKENFEQVTQLKYPYGRYSGLSSKQKSYYAVCPSCLNPIQIIGMGKKSNIDPYGKHSGKTIQDVAKWDYATYINCPYADPSVRNEPTAEFTLLEVTDHIVELYNIFRDSFDLAVLTISDALQIKANANYWRQCLRVFINDQEYCYPWLTDSNLPYIFALLGMVYSNLFGLSFKDGSELCDTLKNIPNVILSNPDENGYRKWIKSKRFTELQFRFLNHQRHAVEGKELKETITICVDEIKNGQVYTWYEQTLVFNESAFRNRRKYVKTRQQWLLDIAREEMPDIQPNTQA